MLSDFPVDLMCLSFLKRNLDVTAQVHAVGVITTNSGDFGGKAHTGTR